MTKENKDLLLQDLCGRLPYGVKMNHIADTENNPTTLVGIAKTMITLESSAGYETSDVEDYIPYLFPLSSMTEEQIEKLKEELCNMYDPYHDYDSYENWGVEVFEKHIHSDNYKFTFTSDVIDWLNKNHFDYRGLIEKGLAINATNLNIY